MFDSFWGGIKCDREQYLLLCEILLLNYVRSMTARLVLMKYESHGHFSNVECNNLDNYSAVGHSAFIWYTFFNRRLTVSKGGY